MPRFWKWCARQLARLGAFTVITALNWAVVSWLRLWFLPVVAALPVIAAVQFVIKFVVIWLIYMYVLGLMVNILNGTEYLIRHWN